MYNELLSEAMTNKNLEKNLHQLDQRMKHSNSELSQQNKLLMLTQRRFENFEHVRRS
jgi:hypothetical protein